MSPWSHQPCCHTTRRASEATKVTSVICSSTARETSMDRWSQTIDLGVAKLISNHWRLPRESRSAVAASQRYPLPTQTVYTTVSRKRRSCAILRRSRSETQPFSLRVEMSRSASKECKAHHRNRRLERLLKWTVNPILSLSLASSRASPSKARNLRWAKNLSHRRKTRLPISPKLKRKLKYSRKS